MAPGSPGRWPASSLAVTTGPFLMTSGSRNGGMIPDGLNPLRHGLGFLVSGSIAFCVDALVLHLLMAWVGLPAALARIGSIALAMVAGWLSHRTLTFAVKAAPSVREFLVYAGVAWFSAGVNYAVFVLILLVLPTA